MNKENLYSALFLLMNKLEDIKDNPMQDKLFVAALTEVLRYFRDNGELKQAFIQQKKTMEDIEKSPFCKGLFEMFCSKMNAEHPDLPQLDMNEIASNFMSDEYIEERINKILGE